MLQLGSSPPTSLIAVFAFSLGQIVAGVVLCRRHGWRGWWLMFLVGNVACVVGQGLLPALGKGYECFASNFWEQVAFVLAVVADGVLNESGDGLQLQGAGEEASASEGDYTTLI